MTGDPDTEQPATPQAGTRPSQGSGEVTVLTGPPGAGKSTVARLVADTLSPSVHLHCDDFWRFIRRGWVAPYRPESNRQNEIVMGVVAEAAFGYAAGGYRVVGDGIVGPWFVDLFRAASTRSGIVLHYVVLRPDQTTTLQRATTRHSEALIDPEPIRSLYRQFSSLGSLEAHVLDSTHLDPNATATAVMHGIAQGAYRLEP